MSSKAQNAAIKRVEQLISFAISDAENGNEGTMYASIETAQSVIKEFSISESLLTEGLPKIYDALMKTENYIRAAKFAKKFEL